MFYECVFDCGRREGGLRQSWDGQNGEECDANLLT